MTRFSLPLLALALTVASAGAGHAAVAFTRMDINNDGVVTFEEARSEIETLAAVHFRKFDRDRDGVVSSSEYAAFDAFLDIMYGNR